MDRVQFFLVQFQHERQRRRKTAFAVPYRLIQAHVVDDHPIDHAVSAEGDARLSSRRMNDAALLVRVAEVLQGEELRIAIGRTVGFRFSDPTGGN
jgi:hypothetical protein